MAMDHECRDTLIAFIILVLFALMLFGNGCDSVSQKSALKQMDRIEASQKTQQEQIDKISVGVKGNGNSITTSTQKITQSINKTETTITKSQTSSQEAVQKSIAMKVGEVGRDLKNYNKTTTNNPWPYVVLAALFFVYTWFSKTFSFWGRK